MNKNEYKKMEEFEKDYWWHRGKRFVLKDILKKYAPGKSKEVLEMGCGAGTITEILSRNHKVLGIDVSEEAIHICHKKGLSNTELRDIFDLDTKKYKNHFDICISLDVLEHIQEDKKAMKIVYDVLKPQGAFIVNVPAHKFLWSEHDEALQHKRRYTRYELRRKLEESGFNIVKETYFVSFVFPIIVFYRTWGNLFHRGAYPKTSYVKLNDSLNNFFTKLLEIETKLIRKSSLPLGTTLIMVAKKA